MRHTSICHYCQKRTTRPVGEVVVKFDDKGYTLAPVCAGCRDNMGLRFVPPAVLMEVGKEIAAREQLSLSIANG